VRVILHTGKGGVGKTTLALASALEAARHGHRVFVLSTDPAHSLADALEHPVGPEPVEVAANVTAREVGVLEELDQAWSEIQGWLRELLREEADAMVADELLVFPGMEELVSLRAVREVERTGLYDVCVVDCAPTGATLRLLRFPDALRVFMERFFELERRGARLLRPLADRTGAGRLIPREEFFDAVERLVADVEDVRQILVDTDRTTARLVVTPARVAVEEARRSFAYLSLFGVVTDAVLVNRELPAAARDGWFATWARRQEAEQREIDESFPVPRFHAPLRPREVLGTQDLAAMGRELFAGSDPARLLVSSRPLRLRRDEGRTVLEIDLPGATAADLEVVRSGTELFVGLRDARRRVALPASLAGLEPGEARLVKGVLEVEFGR